VSNDIQHYIQFPLGRNGTAHIVQRGQLVINLFQLRGALGDPYFQLVMGFLQVLFGPLSLGNFLGKNGISPFQLFGACLNQLFKMLSISAQFGFSQFALSNIPHNQQHSRFAFILDGSGADFYRNHMAVTMLYIQSVKRLGRVCGRVQLPAVLPPNQDQVFGRNQLIHPECQKFIQRIPQNSLDDLVGKNKFCAPEYQNGVISPVNKGAIFCL